MKGEQVKGMTFTPGVGWHTPVETKRKYKKIPRLARMGQNPAFIRLPKATKAR